MTARHDATRACLAFPFVRSPVFGASSAGRPHYWRFAASGGRDVSAAPGAAAPAAAAPVTLVAGRVPCSRRDFFGRQVVLGLPRPRPARVPSQIGPVGPCWLDEAAPPAKLGHQPNWGPLVCSHDGGRRIAKHAAAHPDSRVGRRAGGASQAVKQTVVAVSPPASPAALPVLRRLLPRPLNPCCPACSLSADACRPDSLPILQQ
ncbi:LOW QUALITY PROTEIN: hypothetical protein SETIT_4G191900v2 [Setaria italica]|uniref:Uncharacterized protein n=1 Tax=Setaria italica TaxID=4555 RepID=A0A368QVU5_SETIT|nr:LOW QUALITY PROTEIN: hypothetical protein SETIT_4G191900v2 [Setaria italica]